MPRARRDFGQLIRDLEGSGYTRRRIAARVQVHPSTITRIATGDRRPGYDLGAELVILSLSKLPKGNTG